MRVPIFKIRSHSAAGRVSAHTMHHITSFPASTSHVLHDSYTFNRSMSSFNGRSPRFPLCPSAGSPASVRARTNGSTTVFILARNSCLQSAKRKDVSVKLRQKQMKYGPVESREVLDSFFYACYLSGETHDRLLIIRHGGRDGCHVGEWSDRGREELPSAYPVVSAYAESSAGTIDLFRFAKQKADQQIAEMIREGSPYIQGLAVSNHLILHILRQLLEEPE